MTNFDKITSWLMSNDPVFTLAFYQNELFEFVPELIPVYEFDKEVGKYHHLKLWDHVMEVVNNTPPKAEVRWAALFHDVAKPQCWIKNDTGVHYYGHDREGAKVWDVIAKRLGVPGSFRKHVNTLIWEHQALNNEMGAKGIKRLIKRVPAKCLDDLFAHVEADIKAHTPRIVETKLKELAELRSRVDAVLNAPSIPAPVKMPRGTGDKIAKALGIEPGQELGKIMKRLDKMLKDGKLSSDADFVAEALKLK